MMEMAKYNLIIALSLAIYFAGLNQGVWKDKIITFSSEPYLLILLNVNLYVTA